jgi:hypothetical protein
MYEPRIIIIPVDSNKGREDLEAIENMKFDNREDVERELCFDEDAPMETEKLRIYSLTDFMDACNNSDDDVPRDENINIQEVWIGYIQMKK